MARWRAALRTGLWTAPLAVCASVILAPLWLAASASGGSGRFAHRLLRAWCRLLLWSAGVRVSVEGAEKIAPGASYVFVANRRSRLDLAAALAALPAELRLLVDRRYFRAPGVGFLLHRSGHLPAGAAGPREALHTVTEAARRLAGGTISALVFLDGGQGPAGPLPFRDGAAYLAIRAGVPAVPVRIDGTEAALPPGCVAIGKAAVRITIGEPIPTLDLALEERTLLSERLRDQLSAVPASPAARSA